MTTSHPVPPSQPQSETYTNIDTTYPHHTIYINIEYCTYLSYLRRYIRKVTGGVLEIAICIGHGYGRSPACGVGLRHHGAAA